MTEEKQKVSEDVNSQLLAGIHLATEKIEKDTKSFNKRDAITKVILGSVILCLMAFIVFQMFNSRKAMVRQLINLTDVKDGFVLNDLPRPEQLDKYRKFMIRLIEAYGFQYDVRLIKALSPEQEADYIDLTFKLSELLNFDFYEIPTIHLLESGFNPNAHNEDSGLDEKGLCQMTWETALYAQTLLHFMPERYQRELNFDVKVSDDLKDWETATKATYVLLWFQRRDYDYRDEWYLSVYHWGGFLSRYWYDGKGVIPAFFTINGIKYRVISYYMTVRKLLSCFDRGDLEPSRAIVEIYRKQEQRLMAEEIQLRTCRSIIRRLKTELEQKNFLEKELALKYQDLDVLVNETLVKLNQVYGEASKQKNGEDIRKKLREARIVIQNMLEKTNGLRSKTK